MAGVNYRENDTACLRLTMDLEALIGRIVSSSYMPQAGHPRYTAMIADVERMFADHATDGRVCMEYECVLSFGQLG